jgi:rhamnosyltransferase
MPKLSIIMRSMNDIQYIEQTLEMIKKQSFKDYELLSVDCSSTDGTYEIIQSFNPDITYQIKPSEYIPGKILNDAIKKCNGEIIVFNNSDCIPQNEFWLENLIKPFESDENIAAVYGTDSYFDFSIMYSRA